MNLALEALEAAHAQTCIVGRPKDWWQLSDAITAIKQALEQPAQEPVAWVDLLKQAEEVVRSKSLWKKYIDGTPLANDIAVWMASFTQEHTTPPAAPVAMRMPKVGDRVVCIDDESLGTVVYLTAGGSPEIKFDDGSHGTYMLREFAELFGYTTLPAAPVQVPVAGCACRWDHEDNRISTCERHQGWLEVIAEWADRAREAEAKLKAAAQPAPVAWRWKLGDSGWQLEDAEPSAVQPKAVIEPLYTTPPAQEFVCSTGLCHYRKPLTAREIELIDGMIEVQLDHAQRCDSIANRTMADKQKGWDMERVALLQKLKELNT